MPIFAYKCQGCSHQFDLLVHASTIPTCPECQATNLEKQLTGFAVGGTDGGMDFSGGPGSCGSCGDLRRSPRPWCLFDELEAGWGSVFTTETGGL